MTLKQFSLGATLAILMALTGCSETERKNTMEDKSPNMLAGTVQAIAYSGFRVGQHPDRGYGENNPSEEEILEDLQILLRDDNFTLIRMYDCGQNTRDVLSVIKANNLNMKVMLGAWLAAEFSNHEGCEWLTEPIPEEVLAANRIKNQKEIKEAIRLANQYKDIIVAVNVGNEALVSWNDHMVPVEAVIAYVRQVKNSIDQQVTVNDAHEWWFKDGKELAEEVDFLGVHCYPAWEGKSIDEALAFTIARIDSVRKALPGKPLMLTEAGWATTAIEFGERASEPNQKRYYSELMSWAEKNEMTVFFFEAFDEPWKGNPNNPLGAEKHWGIFTVDRKAKLVMHEKYPDLVPAVKTTK
jgi:exo-beta-1,3-glucanase (GH17 family)